MGNSLLAVRGINHKYIVVGGYDVFTFINIIQVIMKIFIGSSTKYVEVARKIASIIEQQGHQPQLWENCFIATEYTFEKLREICEEVDAGIFVLAPDDQLNAEGNNAFITRDNVLIEAGMFMGKLGDPYTALCKFPEVNIPSDFLGITLIQYSDRNIYTFREKIISWIKKVENAVKIRNDTVFVQDSFPSLAEVVSSAKQEIMMSSFFMSFAQISAELNKAISNGIKVRFLFPDCQGKNWMATVALLDGVGCSEERAKNKLKSTLSWLAAKNEKEQISDTLEIRFLDCVFPIRMTIVDPDSKQGYMFVHINSYKNSCSKNMAYRLSKQQHWFDSYKEQFESMWSAAREIGLNQIIGLL